MKRSIIQAIAAQTAADYMRELLAPAASQELASESIYEHVARDQAQPSVFYQSWVRLLHDCDVSSDTVRERLQSYLQQQERGQNDPPMDRQLFDSMRLTADRQMDQNAYIFLVQAVFPAEYGTST